jgi:hypothetical protein
VIQFVSIGLGDDNTSDVSPMDACDDRPVVLQEEEANQQRGRLVQHAGRLVLPSRRLLRVQPRLLANATRALYPHLNH